MAWSVALLAEGPLLPLAVLVEEAAEGEQASDLRATSVRAYDDRARALLQGTPMVRHYAPSSYARTCCTSDGGIEAKAAPAGR